VGSVLVPGWVRYGIWVVCTEIVALEVNPDGNIVSAQVWWWKNDKEGNPVETNFIPWDSCFKEQSDAFNRKNQLYEQDKGASETALTVPVDVIP
jgi:hypothetical protein